ncbi:female salivary gland protein 3 [Frankliniella occidentalis]|nr:female salivary gland protein 3 [Frankliniella occidentalis]
MFSSCLSHIWTWLEAPQTSPIGNPAVAAHEVRKVSRPAAAGCGSVAAAAAAVCVSSRQVGAPEMPPHSHPLLPAALAFPSLHC